MAGAIAACSSPSIPIPLAPPAAATVDGQPITMAAYEARLKVTSARDPFAGMPEALPSPAPAQRLEDFTIEQLIRETIIQQQAAQRGIKISDHDVNLRITQLEDAAGSASFSQALRRNGFSDQSFRDYERALLMEVALLQAMARQRADNAASALKAGQSFDAVVAKYNDDQGTAGRHGDIGWLRPADLPEPSLASAVETLQPGDVSGLVDTSRGFVIAKVLERRADQVHLAVILILAPTVDMISAQGTPGWFTSFLTDQESALRRDGKITINVGTHAGS
ncbi:MAG TPA: peptidylprolyl isomerase [Candidatus Dormibacteraeota bacterium]